jgi:hypothetical protein
MKWLKFLLLFPIFISLAHADIRYDVAPVISVAQTYLDDIPLQYGTGGTVECRYETADANANALICTAPEGGAVDVPVFVWADASAENVDLGLFNGTTDPTMAILSDDQAKAMLISHDGTNGSIETTSGVIALTDELDLTGASVAIDLNPAATGTQDVIDITPTATLTAGSTYKAFSFDPNALDPLTGSATPIYAFFTDFSSVVSADGNDLRAKGTYIKLPQADTGLSIAHSHGLNEMSVGGTHVGFAALGDALTLSTTATYRGFWADYDNIARDGGAPILEGITVDMPADYSNFGASWGAKFAGGGETVTIIDGTDALVATGRIETTLSGAEIFRLAANSSDYTKFTTDANGGLAIESVDAAAAAANLAITADGTFAVTSTGFNLSSAGAVSGVTTLAIGGALSGVTTVEATGRVHTLVGAAEALRLSTNADDYTGFTMDANGGLAIASVDTAAAAANIAVTADGTYAVTSTGYNLSSAGAVSGVTTLAMGGALSGVTTLAASGNATIDGRIIGNQGADIASGANIVLGGDGNVFELTGTTKVNLISNLTWRDGSQICLIANESVTIDDGTATSGTDITIMVAGGADFNMTANDVWCAVLSSTTAGGQAWREVSRSAN